ncbi:MAG: hypothetical protein LKE37_10085 [Atopobiaceae bacterium]|nr:hypothetical protein [Atopobiaceae bacterium]
MLAALVAGCVYGFRALWSAANANSSSGDSTLSQAISTEKVTPLSDASVSPSTHSFTNYLVLVVDSVDAKPPTLERAVVVVDDTTLGTVREASSRSRSGCLPGRATSRSRTSSRRLASLRP